MHIQVKHINIDAHAEINRSKQKEHTSAKFHKPTDEQTPIRTTTTSGRTSHARQEQQPSSRLMRQLTFSRRTEAATFQLIQQISSYYQQLTDGDTCFRKPDLATRISETQQRVICAYVPDHSHRHRGIRCEFGSLRMNKANKKQHTQISRLSIVCRPTQHLNKPQGPAEPLSDLYSAPAGCSPVAAELNHCEHGTHSLLTCGLSPAAAQPGQGHPLVTKKESRACVRVRANCDYGCVRFQCVNLCGEGLCSSCQPLEIPGNVIQPCYLKNHSARNSPGQQRHVLVTDVKDTQDNTSNTSIYT